MKVLFVGSTQLGFSCLEVLAGIPDISVCGVLTTPSTFTISYAPEGVSSVLYRNFAPLAREIGCPLLTISGSMSSSELLVKIKALQPDCLIVVGWHHTIPNTWLEHWPTFGIHASLLPSYAGGAPLVWAMIEGRRFVGVTLFQLDEGIDSGPIVGQCRVWVRRSDDIESVLRRVEAKTLKLMALEVPRILSDNSLRKPQNLKSRIVYPQRKPSDGEIIDNMSIKQIRNFVRAQTKPYPGAFIEIDGFRVTIWKLGRSKIQVKRRDGLFSRGRFMYLGRGFRAIKVGLHTCAPIKEVNQIV